MNQDRYAISPTWEKNKEFKAPFDYAIGKGVLTEEESQTWDMANGQLLQIHRLDMGDLLKLGVAEEMDFMSKALMASGAKSKEDLTAGGVVGDIVKNSQNYSNMEKMVNAVCLAGILAPKIYPTPEHENAKQKGLFYVDQIPWDDRMELFSVIFETEGITDFREEQADSVGNVADVQDVPLPADGPVDVRPSDTEGVLPQ